MKVTDKQIPIDTKMYEKLVLCCNRCTQKQPKLDSMLILDGYEGYGKTTYSLALAYITSKLTGRPFSEKNVFFDINELIKFAQSTKEQIIIWDEGALGGLSTEWANTSQIKLTKLLMTARKKRHFWIINIPHIFKLNSYIAEDRALGLIHVYARNEVTLGRFVYYNKKKKSYLYDTYKRSRIKRYKDYNFRGTFPNVLDPKKPYNILDVFNEDEYEKQKDKAIMSIGAKADTSRIKLEIRALKYLAANERIKEINKTTLSKWRHFDRNSPEIKQFLLEKWGISSS